MSEVTLEGAGALRFALSAAPERAIAALGAALYHEANDIMTEAKGETPVDTGVLRASGTVFRPQVFGTIVEVQLGFGGAARAYALIQHERTDFNHRVGKDHFLSDPIDRHIPGMEERLAGFVAEFNLFGGI